jgi:hypothetical protein
LPSEFAQNHATLSKSFNTPVVQELQFDELKAGSLIENEPVVPALAKYSHSPSVGNLYPSASQFA